MRSSDATAPADVSAGRGRWAICRPRARCGQADTLGVFRDGGIVFATRAVRRLNPPTYLDLEAEKRFARLCPWNARFGVCVVGSYRLVVLAW